MQTTAIFAADHFFSRGISGMSGGDALSVACELFLVDDDGINILPPTAEETVEDSVTCVDQGLRPIHFAVGLVIAVAAWWLSYQTSVIVHADVVRVMIGA